MAHTLHYLLKLLDNMQRIDGEGAAAAEDGQEETTGDAGT